MTTTPEFLNAAEAYKRAAEQYGVSHPATRLALDRVMLLAPDDLQEAMHAKARELGLIPEAGGYLEDGTPVYRLEDVARQMGMCETEAKTTVARFMQERRSAGLSAEWIDPAQVHCKQ